MTQSPVESELLQRWLAGHDVPCPVCGANLRASSDGRCPECRARIELRLGSTTPHLGLWLAAVLGLALPLGFMAVQLIFLMVEGAVYVAPALALPLAVTTATAAAYCAMLIRLVHNRRAFWKRPRRTQRLLAISSCLLGPGLVVAIQFLLLGSLLSR